MGKKQLHGKQIVSPKLFVLKKSLQSFLLLPHQFLDLPKILF